MNKLRASVLTMFSAVAYSFVNIVLNLIYTREVIGVFGSNVNGLISTLNQFVSFFSVVEGGFTTAAIVSIYQPLLDNDYRTVSDIVYTIKKTLMAIGTAIFALVIGAGAIYVTMIDSPFQQGMTYLLLIESLLCSFLNIAVLAKYTVLLEGANKAYISNLLLLIPRVATRCIEVILMRFTSVDIWVISLINVIEVIVDIILFMSYERRTYSHIDFEGEYRPELIRGTKDVLVQKIAATILSSSDLILISSMVGLMFSSVYSVYSQVFRAASSIVSAVLRSPFNSFGQLILEGSEKEAYNVFCCYKKMCHMFTSAALCTVGVIVIPFVKIYTRGVEDTSYTNAILAVLLYSLFFFQAANAPYGLILNAMGRFDLQNTQCVLSTIVNVGASIVLVKTIGGEGTALGSIIGCLVVLGFNIYQVCNHVFSGNIWKDVCSIVVNWVVGVLVMQIAARIPHVSDSYGKLIIEALVSVILSVIAVITVNFVIDGKETKKSIMYLIRYICKKVSIS